MNPHTPEDKGRYPTARERQEGNTMSVTCPPDCFDGGREPTWGHIDGCPSSELSLLRAENEALRDRLDAVERLLACYRVGQPPSEKLHRDLASSRDALAVIDVR